MQLRRPINEPITRLARLVFHRTESGERYLQDSSVLSKELELTLVIHFLKHMSVKLWIARNQNQNQQKLDISFCTFEEKS